MNVMQHTAKLLTIWQTMVTFNLVCGVVEQTLRRFEQGLGAETPELTNSDSRGLDLFRVVSHGGKSQIWLMGQKILG